MLWHGLLFLCCGAASGVANTIRKADTFKVAEVKPHFGCKSDDGQERVRQYVANLATSGTGLISLIEMEFDLAQPSGYTAFGAACGKHRDPTVVLVNEAQFSIVSTIGATIAGNYSAMPYIGGGQAPGKDTNGMCVADPLASIVAVNESWGVGSRPYTGAVLLHKASGKEICMISGTFPHCLYSWTDQFVADIEKGCGNRQLLIVADTNAGCEIPTLLSDSRWSLNEILANHSQAHWGPCHDPGLHSVPTCCNDFPDFPYPRFWYDRTAVCRGGRVEDFKVDSTFTCGDSRAEHLSTMATINLANPSDAKSPFCLDHPTCATESFNVRNDQMIPVDGLCCPTSASNTNLSCCAAVALV